MTRNLRWKRKTPKVGVKVSALLQTALAANYSVSDYAFSKLRERYKAWTGESLDDKELVSFGLVDDKGKLTNAGALLAGIKSIGNTT